MRRAEGRAKRIGAAAVWLGLGLVLAFLYAPMIPPIINSLGEGGDWLRHYPAMLEDQALVRAARTSLIVGLATAAIAPLLALLAAEAVRVWSVPRLVIGVVLIPLFVPGVSMGVGTALFFQVLGLSPSLATIIAVHVLWALPFAFLIILTVMSTFDPVYLEAAHMSGANRLRAFFEVELPQIHPGILGAAVFSLILSFNETVRTAVVQGGRNTVQTYLWAQHQQVGLSPKLFALMTVLIVATLLFVAGLAVLDRRARRH